MPRNGTKRSLDRANEIYAASAQLFVEKGFEGTSVSDIAEAMSMTKAGLYYYFDSKQELLYKIVQLGLDVVKDNVLDPARLIADPEERLRFVITNHARLAAEDNHAVIIVSHEMSSLSFHQRDHIIRRRREYFEFVRSTILELKSIGKVADIDESAATFTFFGMILWLSRWYQRDGKRSIDEVCRDVCDIALKGLLVR